MLPTLQTLIKDVSLENMPLKWQTFDLVQFSKFKTLHEFQVQGLENAMKVLWLYYKESGNRKENFYQCYQRIGADEKYDYQINKKKDSNLVKYFLDYEKEYPVVNNNITFAQFVNRMSFWMATGSGKTLLIVKLTEILSRLISENELPSGEVLFLTHRDDLVEQFKTHVEEFNKYETNTKIRLRNLREYENVKRNRELFDKSINTVYYYRSDLLSDEQKEKLVSFKHYDNDGKWYILLDEAHKGDRDESRRQAIYSILSRNGFLFNFSATFTDPRDYLTCAFDFNLSKFTQDGYGKHICVFKREVSGFKNIDDFAHLEKQKIVLKTFILLTYINCCFKKIREQSCETSEMYHKPLLLTLVNSVNIKDSDLKLFFNELESVANNELHSAVFEEAKKELILDLTKDNQYEFEDTIVVVNLEILKKITYKDILQNVFNSSHAGKIEALIIPGNRNEIVFKLQTSDRPFALIKIGDITGWLQFELNGYEIIEKYENESIFNQINKSDSEINILMGSRSFYEGWDSNRPNVILFVNIGIGKDSKKFVLQTIGRGVRVEPIKQNKRRLLNLMYNGVIERNGYLEIEQYVATIESLYIFGTNSKNLVEIISTLKDEDQSKNVGDEFKVNRLVENRSLLIPIYQQSERSLAETESTHKYPISYVDYQLVCNYLNHIQDKVALVKYGCTPDVLFKTKDSMVFKDDYYRFNDSKVLNEPEVILRRIFDYFSLKEQKLKRFKNLEEEIVHFRKIRFSGSDQKCQELIEKIKQIRSTPEIKEQLKKIDIKDDEGKEQYYQQRTLFEDAGSFHLDSQEVKIQYLANHYYLPTVISEREKIDYLNHIINVGSETKFIEKLNNYVSKSPNNFEKYDWWMFSKLDETLDEVFIPYYNPKINRLAKFNPDFIFWLLRKNEYNLVFVDPKSPKYVEYEHKVDGYKRIFENDNSTIEYTKDKICIRVHLCLITEKPDVISKEFRKYWFNFKDFTKFIEDIGT